MTATVWLIVFLIALAILITIFARFYERATNETSLVKTGFGGRKIILDGGTLTLPFLQEISRVNMQTLRLDVRCHGDTALITKDRMRVDVGAEFNASVTPTREAVARAAQTLGRRTFQPDQLSALIDGMMVDALRSVAARMTLDELHENRAGFVSQVQESLTDVLMRYGLQLDSVSLTALDQTPFAELDENNVFNAVGMRKLAEVIAKAKKERAQIDADAEVSVRNASMEAARRTMEIELEERRAQIAQQQEIETLSAAQIAEIAQRKAESELSASEARIGMERRIQAAEIERALALEIAEQDRQISVAAKSLEESRAGAEADAARAEAVKAAESVNTAREVAEAERRSKVRLISAKAEAEANAAAAAVAAKSDVATSTDRAAAKKSMADAEKAARMSEAAANKAIIEAENSRSDTMVAMELERARLEAMPKIVAEMVKPIEKISGISINHLSGGFSRGGGGGGGDVSPVNQAIDSIMDMAVQLPALKKIGDSIGLNLQSAFSSVTGDKMDEDAKD